MSHFNMVVFAPRGVTPHTADNYVDIVLAPYVEDESGGKWDWYVIGGRWAGAFNPGYDAETDRRNWSSCTLCNGTGKRRDKVAAEALAAESDYGCNGCGWKYSEAVARAAAGGRPLGVHCNFDNADTIFDVMKTSEIDPAFSPFGWVTLDGDWHEKGEMGWCAQVSNEKPDSEHADAWAAAKAENADSVAILVDCHI